MQNINQILSYVNLTKTDILSSVVSLDIEDDNFYVNNQMRALTLCPNCSGKKSRRKDKVSFLQHYYLLIFTEEAFLQFCIVWYRMLCQFVCDIVSLLK